MDLWNRWGPLFLAFLVFLSLLLHALSKTRETIGEMLWACYVASAILAVGLLLNKPRWVAIGFLFEATLGFPAWLMDALATQSTTFTSCFGHMAPMTAGFLYLRRTNLPKGVLLPAWLLYPLMIAISRWTTPPKMALGSEPLRSRRTHAEIHLLSEDPRSRRRRRGLRAVRRLR